MWLSKLGYVLPISEAFKTGTLEMSVKASSYSADEALSWIAYPTNSLLVFAFTLVFILTLPNFLSIFSLVVNSISRQKNFVTIDNSIHLRQDRNTLSLLFIIPLAMISDRVNLIPIEHLSSVPLEWHSLVTLSVFLIYMVLRYICYLLTASGKKRSDYFRITHQSFYNYLILTSCLLILTICLFSIVHIDSEKIRIVLWSEIAVLYLLSVLRKLQFLYSFCKPFPTFLYLCTLELIPTGVLVAVIVLF